jgi:hypothetical protein
MQLHQQMMLLTKLKNQLHIENLVDFYYFVSQKFRVQLHCTLQMTIVSL